MSDLINYLIQGISLGLIYAISALGVVLIYKSTHIFNFAQGHLALIGAYIMYSLFVTLQWPLWICVVLTLLANALFGWILYRIALRPLIGQPLISSIMVTIALMIGVAGFGYMMWGSSTRSYPAPLLSVPVSFGDLALGSIQIYSSLMAIFVFAGVIFLFKRTKLGQAMRATAEDHDVARSLGVSVRSIFAATWAIASMLGAVSGICLASICSLTPDLGVLGLVAFPIVLLGGLESIGGAIVAGLIVGIVDIFTAAYIDPLVGGEFRDVAPYVLLLIVLFFRPHGLFGEEIIERI